MAVRPWAVALPLALLGLLLAVPLLFSDPYYTHLLILFLLWVTIGSAWNIVAGFTGQVSFGHAAFFGAGAYASGLLWMHLGVSPWWGMAVGGPAAALLSLPFGWVCFPLRGAYFALASLALGEVLLTSARIGERFTGGMLGIQIMPTFTSKAPYYYIALVLAALTVGSVLLITRSRLGYYFVSIREDQDAAESLGVPTTRYKTISLLISTFWTGMAGALYMNYMGFIDPEVVFSLPNYSIMAILVAIVGGAGTVYGPAVGAFVMVTVSELFRSGFFGLFQRFAGWSGAPWAADLAEGVRKAHVLGFGLLVVFVILFLPNGIVGDWKKIQRICRGKWGDRP